MKISSKNFYLHLYGRHKGVTGSCFLGSVHFPNKKNLRFLVDCGNFQGNDNLGYLDLNEVIPFDTQKIDFVLVTHNHIDHIGLLPLLIRQGYRGPIYITKPGYGLIDIPLNEAWKVNCKGKINPSYEQDDVLIIFPGYCSRDSKGYELINTSKGSKIQYGGYTQTLNCDVTVSGEISAHAKRDDLLSFLKNMAEPKSILINHGETDVKLKFSNYLRDKFSPKTKIEVFNPDYAYSIDSNGIFDIYASSFQLF